MEQGTERLLLTPCSHMTHFMKVVGALRTCLRDIVSIPAVGRISAKFANTMDTAMQMLTAAWYLENSIAIKCAAMNTCTPTDLHCQ